MCRIRLAGPAPLNQPAGNLTGNCLFAHLERTSVACKQRRNVQGRPAAANETRGGRKTRGKHKISDDCSLFAGDAAADRAKQQRRLRMKGTNFAV